MNEPLETLLADAFLFAIVLILLVFAIRTLEQLCQTY